MKLEIKNLTKNFNEKVIFNNFSYSFEEKGLYTIIGESGIGKTTLLRAIAGLDTDFVGVIEGGGIKNVSFMFQEYRLFPTLDALKNASIAKTQKNSNQAKELLIRLGFDEDDMKKCPHELSGGMKQRVAFVRALLKDTPVLILDEPTKELDPDTAKIMVDMIAEESKKRLVLVVTHDNIYEKTENTHIISI